MGDVERSSSMGAVSSKEVVSDATNNTEWQGPKRGRRYQELSHGILKLEGCALTNGRGGNKKTGTGDGKLEKGGTEFKGKSENPFLFHFYL